MKNINKKIYIFSFILFSIFTNSFGDEAVNSTLKETGTGAAVSAGTGYAASKAGEAILGKTSQQIKHFFDSPTGIMIVSGIGGLNSYILMDAAQEQADESEKNIKKIEMLMTTFQDSWAGFCPKGHEDMKDPPCYCYTDLGKPNPNRTNSQTCKDLWAKLNFKVGGTADSYLGQTNENQDPKGCLTGNNKFDEGCKCKKFVDSQGNNACKKIPNLVTLGNGNSFMTDYLNKSGVKKLNEAAFHLTQGNIGLGNLNANSMAIAKAGINGLNKNIVDSLLAKNQGGFRGYNSMNDVLKAQNSTFPKKVLDTLRPVTGGGALALNLSPNPSLKSALSAVTKRTGLDITEAGKGLPKKGEDKGMNFNFNEPSASNGGKGVEFEEPQKVYKVKGDINADSGASIFQIISNRYLESGVRKLFDEEEKK